MPEISDEANDANQANPSTQNSLDGGGNANESSESTQDSNHAITRILTDYSYSHEAAHAFFSRFYYDIFMYAHRAARHWEKKFGQPQFSLEAEEITHDVILRILENGLFETSAMESMGVHEKLPYVIGVTKLIIMEHLRKNRRMNEKVLRYARRRFSSRDLQLGAELPLDPVVEPESILELIQQLPELQQKIVRSHFYENKSFSQIADETGLKKTNSYKIFKEAMQHIRQLAEKAGLGD